MNQPNRKSQRGFTLVEVMVVIVILGMIATIVTTSIIGQSDEARIKTTKMQIITLLDTVELFYSKNGRMPTDWNELIEKDSAGYQYLKASEPPVDSWSNEIRLQPHPSGRRNDILIVSVGPDGNEGSEDDITSENAKKRDEKK